MHIYRAGLSALISDFLLKYVVRIQKFFGVTALGYVAPPRHRLRVSVRPPCRTTAAGARHIVT